MSDLIDAIHVAVQEGQRRARQATRARIANCPPSREFPVEHGGAGWQANRDAQVERWAVKYPDLPEEHYVRPLVEKVLTDAVETVRPAHEPWRGDEEDWARQGQEEALDKLLALFVSPEEQS